jgi:hypothetical protein
VWLAWLVSLGLFVCVILNLGQTGRQYKTFSCRNDVSDCLTFRRGRFIRLHGFFGVPREPLLDLKVMLDAHAIVLQGTPNDPASNAIADAA